MNDSFVGIRFRTWRARLRSIWAILRHGEMEVPELALLHQRPPSIVDLLNALAVAVKEASPIERQAVREGLMDIVWPTQAAKGNC